jgi:alpha-1,6-mannosyltransferase
MSESLPVVIDLNNFWSPSGGGVRRYHLQKMDYYKNQREVKLVFLMQDSSNYTEEISPGLVIEHVKAFKIPGRWEYRFIWDSLQIRRYLLKYAPAIVEVGSPYILPAAVRRATWGLKRKPALVGFWHADFPVTYVRRFFGRLFRPLGVVMEKLAWAYARYGFSSYASIQVSSCEVMVRMQAHGMGPLRWIPLGVDIEAFHPHWRDEALVQELKAGDPDRLTIFFPHRFSDEKGLRLLIEAYPDICARLGSEPAIVFAGTGPDFDLIEEASKTWKHLRYVGFVRSVSDMARWYASCELGLALSGWETFGLSILESMASGQCLVGASTGAAGEHIRESGCGVLLESRDAQGLADAVVQVAARGLMAGRMDKARQYAERFSWQACFDRQMVLYREYLPHAPA